ncbi:hypothetical protein [Streptomyces sp. NBC_00233]|uniref:hypothetical protein n=1 Tax=Streptomyces sp. NBC_00233 TaxID=2975686 RepID=UPI0022583668|nr:hypothetical protein [Streptomyces sp. NBC_00233]MCX5231453.1 hypothetical protein [Streptomyces sp. NBC_00233]MCX5233017.1 hypothetical protein [Streptomyces sp. NBC_00233]
MHDTDHRIDRGTPDERADALAEWDSLVRKALADGDSALPRALPGTHRRASP